MTSNEVIEDIMKILKSLEECCLLIKGPSKAIENHTKKQNGGYLSMTLAKLEATIIFIIFWDFFIFYQIFLSPEVKWSAFSSNKQDIYKLPQ